MKRLLIAILLSLICAANVYADVKIGGGSAAAGEEIFGYTTEGGTGTGITTGRVYQLALSSAVTNSGTLTKIEIYSSNTEAADDIEIGLYKGATYNTATYVGKKAFSNIGTWSLGWKAFDMTDAALPIVATSQYWLSVNHSTSPGITFYYNAVGNFHYKVITYGNAWPNPYGTDDGGLARTYSIRGTVTY